LLEIRWRGRNDAQDLGGDPLPFERLRDLAVAPLQLLEESCVLDGDDGLIGKRL